MQGILVAALTSYQASHDICDHLAIADPSNAGWQRDLSLSHIKIGEVKQAQGTLTVALTSYRASLAIADRLAKRTRAMPAGSATCRCRTSRSATCSRPRATSRGADELQAAYKIIFDRLAKADPGNAGWQRDLAATHSKIGDLQQARRISRRP